MLYIHKEFSKELLVNIFRPFLYYYYIVNYDTKDTIKNQIYNSTLFNKLKKFYEYNRLFGRRYIKITTNKNKNKRIVKKDIKFNSDHIGFHKIIVHIQNKFYDTEYIFNPPTPINVFINNNYQDQDHHTEDDDTEYDTAFEYNEQNNYIDELYSDDEDEINSENDDGSVS
jgi:hypothetical protein